jgi:hypothetical protein
VAGHVSSRQTGKPLKVPQDTSRPEGHRMAMVSMGKFRVARSGLEALNNATASSSRARRMNMPFNQVVM